MSKYKFKLFVTDKSDKIISSFVNMIQNKLKDITSEEIEFEVFDVFDEEDLIQKYNLEAIPSIEKSFPLPKKILIGELYKEEKIKELLKKDEK